MFKTTGKYTLYVPFHPSISIFIEVLAMEVMKVHKKILRDEALGCRIVITILDVCDTAKKEDGCEVLNFYQIYNVREVWTIFD